MDVPPPVVVQPNPPPIPVNAAAPDIETEEDVMLYAMGASTEDEVTMVLDTGRAVMESSEVERFGKRRKNNAFAMCVYIVNTCKYIVHMYIL